MRLQNARTTYLRCAIFLFLVAALADRAISYVLTGEAWPEGRNVLMQLELGPTNAVLQDGLGTWDGSAAHALALWNQHLKQLRFTWVNNSTAPRGAHNGINTVSFSSSVYGEGFGSDTLAVTVWWTTSSDPSVTNEADVLFNTAFHFNSYRGPLQGDLYDFHRVALHEFGHVLGLDHPDEGGQSVEALMNSVISNLDHLALDDIAGAEALYGYHLTSVNAPDGQIGVPFSFQITSDNSPSSFSAIGLPPGLHLNTRTGLISGIPTVAAISVITVTAHSSLGDATAEILININPPAITSSAVIQPFNLGEGFSYQIEANNNPVSFGATGLPPGLRLNPSTGMISGVATLSGYYDATITATGNATGTASRSLSFNVQAPSAQFIKSFPLSGYRLLGDGVQTESMSHSGMPAGWR